MVPFHSNNINTFFSALFFRFVLLQKANSVDGKVDFELEKHSEAAEYWWGRKNPLHNLNKVR